MNVSMNPDRDFAKSVKKQIKSNAGYCISALERGADTKCMCKEFRDMSEGMCRCGLYIKTK